MNQHDQMIKSRLAGAGFPHDQIDALMECFKTIAPVKTTKTKKEPEEVGVIAELGGNIDIAGALSDVSRRTQRLWLETYPDGEWIKHEILKALTWLDNNPQRRPKKFGLFMNSWLSRGWEIRRKNQPTGGPGGLDKSRWT